MNGRELGRALRDGRRVYGTLVVSTSPRWCDAVRADRERFRSALGETAGQGGREDLIV